MSIAAYAMTVIVIVPFTLLLLDLLGRGPKPQVVPIVPEPAAPDLDGVRVAEGPRPVHPSIRPGDGMVYRGPLAERR